jgi:hypothetical protein
MWKSQESPNMLKSTKIIEYDLPLGCLYGRKKQTGWKKK